MGGGLFHIKFNVVGRDEPLVAFKRVWTQDLAQGNTAGF